MATEVGSIYTAWKLDPSDLKKGLIAVNYEIKSTEKAGAASARALGQVYVDQAKKIQQSSNSIAQLQDRFDRLRKLLENSRLGSDRFESLRQATMKASQELEAARKQASLLTDQTNQSSRAMDLFRGVATTLAGGAALGALETGIVNLADTSQRLENTFLGLSAVVRRNLGAEAVPEARKQVSDLARELNLSDAAVAKSTKDLVSMGFQLDQVSQILRTTADMAVTGRQAHLDMDGALNQFTEGLKNNMSTLTDAAGMTENLSSIYKKLGITTEELNDKQNGQIARQKLANYLMQEGAAFAGQAAEAAQGYAGATGSLDKATIEFQASLGAIYKDELTPVLFALADVTKEVADFTTELGPAGKAAVITGTGIAGLASASAAALPAVAAMIDAFKRVKASLDTAALGAAGKWAAILGPLALGVTAMTFVAYAVIKVREERDERDTAQRVGTGKSLSSGEYIKDLENQIEEIKNSVEARKALGQQMTAEDERELRTDENRIRIFSDRLEKLRTYYDESGRVREEYAQRIVALNERIKGAESFESAKGAIEELDRLISEVSDKRVASGLKKSLSDFSLEDSKKIAQDWVNGLSQGVNEAKEKTNINVNLGLGKGDAQKDPFFEQWKKSNEETAEIIFDAQATISQNKAKAIADINAFIAQQGADGALSADATIEQIQDRLAGLSAEFQLPVNAIVTTDVDSLREAQQRVTEILASNNADSDKLRLAIAKDLAAQKDKEGRLIQYIEQTQREIVSLEAQGMQNSQQYAVAQERLAAASERAAKNMRGFFGAFGSQASAQIDAIESKYEAGVERIEQLGLKGTQKIAAETTLTLGRVQAYGEAIGGSIVNLLNSTAQLAQAKLANIQQKLNTFADLASVLAQREQERADEAFEAEMDRLDAEYAAIEEAEREHQQRMSELREEQDAALKTERDQKFNAYVADLHAQYEAERDLRLAGIQDEELRKQIEEDLWMQFLEDKKQASTDFDAWMAEQKAANDEEMSEKEDEKAQSDLEKKKALDEQRKALEDKKEAEDKARANRAAKLQAAIQLMEWQSGKAAFEAQKQAQIAQAMLALSTTIAQAAVASAAIIAGVSAGGAQAAAAAGPAAPAVMAAYIGMGTGMALGVTAIIAGLSMYANLQSLQAAQSQQYPPPPVAALAAFADGGIADRPAIFGERGRELAIPMYDNPGKDFGALKDAIARELVSGAPAGNSYSFQNTFHFHEAVAGPEIVDYVSRELVREMEAARG